ncbi:DUF1573 domain-containing protein [Flavobacterium agrisoli]|uniref:DUF1573 domain-containing protein n=1 Tax=Flavobacterium agrisoli TaxID=2793066 RepID=A0A934PKR4_9FLAO|nr:DUF1573 domain-containing protein [Flavobacterium agrisoli]MBK0368723.1 DUF1573 domain-containing protein [Flavobacterium agrisoli]
MKNFLFCFTLLLGFIATAQKGAKIHFAHSENTIDYGTIKKGSDNGVREVNFTNKGDEALEIISVQSTSGITIMSKPISAIGPGKSDKIVLKYNMALGPIRKTITIETNAVNYPEGRVAIKLKGDVEN